MKPYRRWPAALLAAALTTSISLFSVLSVQAEESFSDFRIDASGMDTPDRTISINLYRRNGDTFQVDDKVEYSCRVNRVTEDASFYIQPSADGVWASVDYLTDLNGDGTYELLDGEENPVWDVLDPQGGLIPPAAQSVSPTLPNAQTYILSGESLLQRYQQAVQSRGKNGAFSLDVGQGAVQQEAPLCMVKLHYTASTGEEEITQTYYLELHGTVLIPSDLSASAPYYEAVKYGLSKGYFSGGDNGLFDPDGQLTRAQLAQVLWIMGGSLHARASQFSDVKSTDWFYSAVSWCQQEELIAGYNDGTFAPHDKLSREQMLSILFRYARHTGAPLSASADLTPFSDASDVSAWAVSSVRWALANGLVSGSDSTLRPGDAVTRAELAAALYTYDTTLGEQTR